MVPQPLPYEHPTPAWVADPTLKSGEDVPVPPLPFKRNTSGRPWKADHGATVRTQNASKSSTAWEKRQVVRKKTDAVKKLEKEMKDEKETEAERKRNITKERKTIAAEKARLAEMAAKMSAKKLQRMKKRMGRTKKISA